MVQNPELYDQFWQTYSLQNPKKKYTWESVKKFEGKPCLEIGCGNHPIIPLKNSYFLDISQSAVNNLRAAGLRAYLGSVEKLPFKNNFFNLVVAWHIMEHVKDDKRGFSEIGRVLKRGGYFLFASPLWMDKFSELDRILGHKRRYQSDELIKILKKNQLEILKFKAEKGLIARRILANLLLPLALKVYQRFKSISHFVIFRPTAGFLARLMTSFEKRATSKWQRGEPSNVIEAENIVVFCKKG